MKQCPACNRTYSNDDFAFCLADGTLLSAPYEKTLVLNELPDNQPQATEILSPEKSDAKGESTAGVRKPSDARRRWDEESFFQEVAKHPDKEIAESLRVLYRLSKEIADKVDFGSGTRRGSFNVKFSYINSRSFYTVYSDGTMELNFSWLRGDEKSAAVAEKLGQGLRQLPGFIIPNDFQEKYITIKPEQWSQQIIAFISVIQAVTKHED